MNKNKNINTKTSNCADGESRQVERIVSHAAHNKHIKDIYAENDIVLFCGDAREITKGFDDEMFDMVFTDPPYPKEFLPLYKWLGIEGYRLLKEDRFIIAYAGPYWKQQTMNYLNVKFDYYYDFILRHNGNTTILWPKKIISGYKSILCYVKGKALPRKNVLGFYTGSGGDKRYHKWGQEEFTARYYVDCFTDENDLIFEPFLGGGTTAVVCKYLRRKCIAIELDPKTFEVAVNRLKDTDIPQKSEQINMFEEAGLTANNDVQKNEK